MRINMDNVFDFSQMFPKSFFLIIVWYAISFPSARGTSSDLNVVAPFTPSTSGTSTAKATLSIASKKP